MPQPPDSDTALAIICGGGTLPFALADAAIRRGRRVVLFALREWADPQRVVAYPHHWTWIGQFGRFLRTAEKEGLPRRGLHRLGGAAFALEYTA